jgi:hypothetical protein|tara:strand:- start:1525 stop:2247 length:723 start_codon:yes stop_codon:yes gene_type:complete
MNELNKYEGKKYSQWGEDGITTTLCRTIYGEDTDKYFVEFGVQCGGECNTRILREAGWDGLLMDGDNENLSINLRKEFVTRDNIVDLLKKYDVPKHINLLSVDIDGNDFYVIDKILKEYDVDILISEYNASRYPDEDAVIEYQEDFCWDKSDYFGASLLALTNLMNSHGLSLVCSCFMGVNSFFVKNELVNQYLTNVSDVDNVRELYYPPRYGAYPLIGHPKDDKNRKYITSEEAMRDND